MSIQAATTGFLESAIVRSAPPLPDRSPRNRCGSGGFLFSPGFRGGGTPKARDDVGLSATLGCPLSALGGWGVPSERQPLDERALGSFSQAVAWTYLGFVDTCVLSGTS